MNMATRVNVRCGHVRCKRKVTGGDFVGGLLLCPFHVKLAGFIARKAK